MSIFYAHLTSQDIYKLPLLIKNTNTSKGFGIFASADIDANVIIAVYCGFVTTLLKMPYTSNDLFTLEHFQHKSKELDTLIIIPIKTCCGFGRFFNGVVGQ